ncbi:8516_t:CDS:2, partial [Racocetra persica]
MSAHMDLINKLNEHIETSLNQQKQNSQQLTPTRIYKTTCDSNFEQQDASKPQLKHPIKYAAQFKLSHSITTDRLPSLQSVNETLTARPSP